MAGRRSPVTDIRELIRRLQKGEPDRRIARDLAVSRNTVARYRQWATDQGFLAAGAALPEPAMRVSAHRERSDRSIVNTEIGGS